MIRLRSHQAQALVNAFKTVRDKLDNATTFGQERRAVEDFLHDNWYLLANIITEPANDYKYKQESGTRS